MPLKTYFRVRRSVAVAASAVLTLGLAIAGISTPAGAAPVKGYLTVVSVTDITSGLGAPVQDRPFDVVVKIVDRKGNPTTVSEATTIVLEEVAGPGALGGTTMAVIPSDGSGATISGAKYGPYANSVELRVRAEFGGVALAPGYVTVDVALTAVGDAATPTVPFKLSDQAVCPTPTPQVPTCGYLLLPNGANGHVTLSLGSCDGVADCRAAGPTEALVVMALADLKDQEGDPLYGNQAPATLVVACDKVLCGQAGVPKLPLLFSFADSGPLTEEAPPCPAKGVLGEGQEACVDYVQSTRDNGDLYSYLLFDRDLRASHP
jgi:hypothetical protein